MAVRGVEAHHAGGRVGCSLGLLRDGDEIELDVAAGTIRVVLSPEQLARRCSATSPRDLRAATPGCHFDFLRPDFPARVDVAG